MKGVVLAGGRGIRMSPLTIATNKHLLPVYDRPMIFYPLQSLVEAGIREILILTCPEHAGTFFKLLGNGVDWGCRFSYVVQEESRGTGDGLLRAEQFAAGEDVAVILGDNIFTEELGPYLKDFHEQTNRRCQAKILLSKVKDPRRYGVAVLKNGRVIDVVEKPAVPPTEFAVTGLWMFGPEVFDRLRELTPSARGEYEATDVLARYAREGLLAYAQLKSTWMDVGTFESLYDATVYMRRASEGCSRVNRAILAEVAEVTEQGEHVENLNDDLAAVGPRASISGACARTPEWPARDRVLL